MDIRLPPYQMVHGNCPKCRQDTSWYISAVTPVESANYDVQIYQETSNCGRCGFHYNVLRPTQLRPCQPGCNCNTCQKEPS
jgi:C4-type Zn-finger protein